MSKKRQNYMAKADVLFSKAIKDRDGGCVAEAPHKGQLQCAHIISRSYKSIRTNPDNAVTLCQSHHVYYTHRPLEWQEWVEDRFPGRWDELKQQALSYERVDWRAEYEALR
jgi:5-methylcytosine-specific restriction endonuclease McrA